MTSFTSYSASNIEWVSKMNVDIEPIHGRKTSIIGTIGPDTNNVETITQLREAGLNIVRMNFSHGSYEYHKSVIENTRKSTEEHPGFPVAIALDNKGPEIRIGQLKEDQEITIEVGDELVLSVDEKYAETGTSETVYVDYKNLPKMLEVGKKLFIDDGLLSFEVIDISEEAVRVVAQNKGQLSSRKNVKLPGTPVDLPALSEKDIKDLRWGIENGIDFIFASFIRRAQDVRDIRRALGAEGKDIRIISKIESYQGVENFDEILEETDGIMVARGDLGIEIPLERVFIAQKKIITKCNLAGKPVICSTQLLESMTHNPRPTRAETSDVANAVLDGVDGVMLSSETAKGKYPVEAVKTMHSTCKLAEAITCYPSVFNQVRQLTAQPTETTETVACAAVAASHEQNAGCILVLTASGNSARLLSKYRPNAPIIAITRKPQTAQQLQLHRGCFAFYCHKSSKEELEAQNISWQEDVDRRIRWGLMEAMKYKLVQRGDPVVVVQGWKGGLGNTNTLRIIYAP
ncbi:pyruvate kinase [Sporodiniella umbellata]|nr:pyruvate kinase [Sporodiniella umbellata]